MASEIERFTFDEFKNMVPFHDGEVVRHSAHLADKAAELERLAEKADAEAERWQRKRAKCKQDEADDRASGKLKKGHSYGATWNYYEGLARASEWSASCLRERAAEIRRSA